MSTTISPKRPASQPSARPALGPLKLAGAYTGRFRRVCCAAKHVHGAADFLYASVPGLPVQCRQHAPVAREARQRLQLFDEQDSLAKALLQEKLVHQETMQPQNGDFTSPDRHLHFLAPASSDALPHWSGDLNVDFVCIHDLMAYDCKC